MDKMKRLETYLNKKEKKINEKNNDNEKNDVKKDDMLEIMPNLKISKEKIKRLEDIRRKIIGDMNDNDVKSLKKFHQIIKHEFSKFKHNGIEFEIRTTMTALEKEILEKYEDSDDAMFVYFNMLVKPEMSFDEFLLLPVEIIEQIKKHIFKSYILKKTMMIMEEVISEE